MVDKAKPLIVVLGIGEMGTEHARNLCKIRTIRVGIASSREQALTKTTSSLCVDKTYNDYDAALQDPEVKGVIIATPPATHPDMIERAAKAGKHIFSEKPLGNDSPSIIKAIDVVRDANVRLMTGFMRRWDRGYSTAYDRISTGALGKVVVLKCTSGDAEYPEKYHRDALPFSILKDLSVHDVDLARWYTGSDVKRVYAILDALSYPTLSERHDGDVAIAVLEMESGAKVTLHLSRALQYGYNVSTEIACQKGSLRVGDLGRVDVDELANETNSRSIDRDFTVRFGQAFQDEMAGFVELVLADDSKYIEMLASDTRFATEEDGLKATIVAEALVQSAQDSTPVDVVYH